MFTGYSNNFYSRYHDIVISSARQVVPIVLELTGAERVVDVGCGQGAWLSVFRELGAVDIVGLDGPQVDRKSMLIPEDRFRAVNLERPEALRETFDLAMSLEVAEHLAPASAQNFVDFLTSLAPVILFSAAIPMQDGTHHVNEQWPAYWVALFKNRNFTVVDALRPAVWNSEKVAAWYRQNLLIYVRQDKLSAYPALQKAALITDERMLSVVHPSAYLRSNERPMGSFCRLARWLPRLAVLKLLRMFKKW